MALIWNVKQKEFVVENFLFYSNIYLHNSLQTCYIAVLTEGITTPISFLLSRQFEFLRQTALTTSIVKPT
jgi:hypothetical protein